MIPGQKQALLPSKYSPECFPQPPPASRGNTVYALWKDLDCIPNSLPIWQQSPYYSVRYAAQTYECCAKVSMIPFNVLTYKICCCGKFETCDCNVCEPIGQGGACLVSMPKLPCCMLAGVSACTAGVVGLVADGYSYCGPKQESMDVTESSEYKAIPDSQNLQQSTQVLSEADKRLNLIKYLLENKQLQEIIIFYFKNKGLMDNHPTFYPYKVFFICLAITCPDEKITLSVRKDFIQAIADPYSIRGYNSEMGWIPGPLLEATRSTYRHSSELLELVCDFGAKSQIYFLLTLAYDDVIANPQDHVLFYKLLLLRKYETDRPEQLTKFFNSKAEFKKLNDQILALDEPEKDPKKHRRTLNEELTRVGLPNNVAAKIGQYTALYSPVQFMEHDQTIIESKSIASLIAHHSELISEVEQQNTGLASNAKLSKHQPLPPYKELPPEVSQTADMAGYPAGLM